MILSGLRLNEEKPELLLLSSCYRPSPSLEFVRVGGDSSLSWSDTRSQC